MGKAQLLSSPLASSRSRTRTSLPSWGEIQLNGDAANNHTSPHDPKALTPAELHKPEPSASPPTKAGKELWVLPASPELLLVILQSQGPEG